MATEGLTLRILFSIYLPSPLREKNKIQKEGLSLYGRDVAIWLMTSHLF